MVRPNGIAFSPDEKYLYVADTGATHKENGPRHIRRFTVDADGAKLSGGEIFAEVAPRACSTAFASTGMAASGRAPAEGVHCYDPDGTLIGKILIPEMVANVTFGGAKLNRLFICGTTSLYSIYVTANGSKLGLTDARFLRIHNADLKDPNRRRHRGWEGDARVSNTAAARDIERRQKPGRCSSPNCYSALVIPTQVSMGALI